MNQGKRNGSQIPKKAKSATAKKKRNNMRKKVNMEPSETYSNRTTTVVLSKCATDYGRALSNPFTGPLACVPIAPSVYSLKVRTWVKGEFRTSSTGASPTGVGFICVDPYCGVTYDIPCVIHSDAAYQGTTVAYGAAGTSSHYSNSAYAAGNFGDGATTAQYRIVASGLRIRYIGTELNRGGTIIAFRDPTGSSTIGQDITTLLAEVESKKFPVNRVWTTLCWRPSQINDYGFNKDPSTTDTNLLFGPICMIVESPDPSIGAAFEYEFSSVYEINGKNVRGQTLTTVDVNGQSAIASTSLHSEAMKAHQSSVSHSESFLDQVANELARASSFVHSTGKVASGIVELGSKVVTVAKTLGALA